ncbi:NAD(P)H-binding protein [Larkinella rosea]|uniref:NAD-dependent epimerase/dehydratase family protein n=1 Tax=Larkinella rosea TaxID=2025312 RepID=A0A3P1BT46_9BACT|nr:NAD(P)H-binding protein [Larkinella rosea]RRB04281.1 NAD-dependent epimerase/dehydratase family protein [Larkinella rosea]
MKVVVTGSLGHIGQPLTQLLVQRGHAVTVVSRTPDKQKDIEALGATAAIGSLEDVDFLASTFAGADVVHAMIPPNNAVPNPMARNRMLGDCLARAIGQSDVKRAVYVSSYGAQLEKGTGLIVGHHHTENALNALPNLEALTHLRATYIYYNLYAYLTMIKTTGFIRANYGDDDRVVLVSPQDIAAAAADEIENQKPGKIVKYVASDERTCREIAQILGRAIGKPDLKWVTITDEQMQSGMEANGVPALVAGQLVEMFGACHSGILHDDYDRHRPTTMGNVKIEDFAREFAVAFNQK